MISLCMGFFWVSLLIVLVPRVDSPWVSNWTSVYNSFSSKCMVWLGSSPVNLSHHLMCSLFFIFGQWMIKKNLSFPGLSIKSTGSFVVNICFNHSYINNVSHGLLVANTCFSHSYIKNVSCDLLLTNTCFSHRYISNVSSGLLLTNTRFSAIYIY